LDSLARKSRHAVEREVLWDTAPLVAPRALDLAFLATQVPCVLHGRFGAGDIEWRCSVIELEAGKLAGPNQVGEMRFGLPKQLARGHFVASCGFHSGTLEDVEIACKT
jgi:hypothetical protein